jgi:uncharacterized membrane protein
MDKLVAIVVPDEKKGSECMQALEDLHDGSSITLYSTAVIKRDEDKARVLQRDDTGPAGVVLGSMIGLLVGALGGPVGIAAGAAGGSLVGFAHADISEEFVEEVVHKMRPGDVVVVAEILEEWTTPLDERVARLGGTIIREPRGKYVEDLFQRRVDADKANLEAFKKQRATAKTERMESALDHEIETTADKLRQRAEKANERIDRAKDELQAKLNALQEQASKADPEVRKRIEQRIGELRKDFSEREEKLRRAYEMTQDALRA